MFVRLTRLVFLATLLLAVGEANAGPTIFGTYYDETVTSGSCGSNTCRLNFSQTPADKLVLVSKINCNLQTNLPPPAFFFQIATTNGGNGLPRAIYLPFSPSILSGGIYYTTFREDTQFLVGQGRFPYVSMGFLSGVVGNMSCTLIGSLVSPSP